MVDTGRSFHVHATTTLEYRVVFPDGCYVVGSAVEHISFSANAPQTVDTTTVQEQRIIYLAAGEPIGRVVIHAVSHVTFRDANGNGEPDPREITASVDRFFFYLPLVPRAELPGSGWSGRAAVLLPSVTYAAWWRLLRLHLVVTVGPVPR